MTAPDSEYRIFGPPGTGKTTYLSRQIHKAAEARGSDEIVVGSFTKAAASEIAGRKLPLNHSQIGTLHALAYRVLDRPTIAQGELDSWNEHSPHFALSGAGQDDLEDAALQQSYKTLGDELLNKAEKLRAQRTPTDHWPTQVLSFHRRWCDWKAAEGLMDFTDLIETALADVSQAPGSPSIGFFDEVQDFTPLELALVRKWGGRMETMLLAGDDDQCIYWFKGATPDAFLDPPVGDEQKRVLSESFRVPRQVHACASAWVDQLSRREPKAYNPRDAEGDVSVWPSSWRNPTKIVDAAAELADAGETVMVLASCSYMLDPLKGMLRDAGLPFHNPYRTKRGDWNPLRHRKDAVTATDRLMAFLQLCADVWGTDARMWTHGDLHRWVDKVSSKKGLVHGAKAEVRRRANDPDVEPTEVDLAWLAEQVFEDPDDLSAALDASEGGDVDWLLARVLSRARKPLEFPAAVFKKRGAEALSEPPKVVIGTIHSVKGGQADHVFLFPDLSGAGMRDWVSPGPSKESIVRQFYVGMTRAKRTLKLCSPATQAHVEMRRYVPS